MEQKIVVYKEYLRGLKGVLTEQLCGLYNSHDPISYIEIQIWDGDIKIRNVCIGTSSIFIIHGTNTTIELKPYCFDVAGLKDIDPLFNDLESKIHKEMEASKVDSITVKGFNLNYL